MNNYCRNFIIIFCWLAIFCHVSVQAQNISNLLCGTFSFSSTGEEDSAMYDAFVFDGAGKVKIETFMETECDFLQIDDTVVVFTDKDLLLFQLNEDNRMLGLSMWIKDKEYRKVENDTVSCRQSDQNEKWLSQFYEYYRIMKNEDGGLLSFFSLKADTDLENRVKQLCENGFSKACLTMANLSMMNDKNLWLLFSNSTERMAPDPDVVGFYEKSIELGDLEGYTQLGAYYTMLNMDEEADKLFEKGCELGQKDCCLAKALKEIDDDY